MRIWCAQCKRVQQVIEQRNRRRKRLEQLAGTVGFCAVCHFPVSAIGTALRTARRGMLEQPLAAAG